MFDGSCMDERELSGWSWQPYKVTEQSLYYSALGSSLKSHTAWLKINKMKSERDVTGKIRPEYFQARTLAVTPQFPLQVMRKFNGAVLSHNV